MDFRHTAADLGQRHMNQIATLEQQKQTIIHNAQLYVNICNSICAGLDQQIEQHKAALSTLTHQMHGTQVPMQQQQPAPQQQQGFAPGTAQQAAAKVTPKPVAQKPAEPEPKTEVVHTPPPAPNGQS